MLSTAAVLLHKVVEVAEPWRSLYADSTVVSTTVLSAHLGGMLIGFLYYRFIHDSPWSLGSPDRPEFELPRWLRRFSGQDWWQELL